MRSSLGHSVKKFARDATVTFHESTMALILCLSDKVDIIAGSDDLKRKLEALIVDYARNVDLTKKPNTILTAIGRCLQMQVATGAQIIVERLIEVDILNRNSVTGAEVYIHDRTPRHTGPHPKQTEGDPELRVDTLLKSFRENTGYAKSKSDDLLRKIAHSVEPILFPWLQVFLGPRPPEPEITRQEVKELLSEWTCDRPSCVLIKRYLTQEVYTRQRLTLKSLGPRVISHLSKELDENISTRIATYQVDANIDTIHVTSTFYLFVERLLTMNMGCID